MCWMLLGNDTKTDLGNRKTIKTLSCMRNNKQLALNLDLNLFWLIHDILQGVQQSRAAWNENFFQKFPLIKITYKPTLYSLILYRIYEKILNHVISCHLMMTVNSEMDGTRQQSLFDVLTQYWIIFVFGGNDTVYTK